MLQVKHKHRNYYMHYVVPGAYKGKEHSTAVFVIVISKSKVCRRALLLLGT